MQRGEGRVTRSAGRWKPPPQSLPPELPFVTTSPQLAELITEKWGRGPGDPPTPRRDRRRSFPRVWEPFEDSCQALCSH